MRHKTAVALAFLSASWIFPLEGQQRLTLNMGGGVTTPLNPTGAYTGISGNFVFGAGYNLNNKNSISGEFLWSGLPPSVFTVHPVDAPYGNINLYSLTVNYRHHIDSIHGSPFGLYAIGGGGWYYRYANVDKNYTLPPAVVCQPIYYWWGYGCADGYVYSTTVAYRGVSAGGVNGGVGFTIRLSDSGFKFYTEARYHYAFSERVPTTLIPVTFGIRYN